MVTMMVDLWGPCDSAEKRLGLTGRLLLNKIKEHYNRTNRLHHDWYGKDAAGHMVRLLKRARDINNRDENVIRTRYKDWAKKKGLNQLVASQAVTLVPLNPWHPDARFVLASGHRVEGVYDAVEEQPDNEQWQATIAGGFEVALDLVAGTPEDSSSSKLNRNANADPISNRLSNQ